MSKERWRDEVGHGGEKTSQPSPAGQAKGGVTRGQKNPEGSAAGTTPPSDRIFHLLILTILPLSLYWQVIFYDFTYFDDQAYILENNLVKQGVTLDGIFQAMLSTYASNWHPVTWISHMVDFQIFGLNGGAFHAVNALFHILNTLLLYLLFSLLTGSPARSLFVAALFTAHPLHVESVAWISERKDLLSTFFMLLTLLLYVRYTRVGSKLCYLAALPLFLFGVMSKPTVVTLPCLLILLDFWPLKRNFHLYLLIEKIPFFLITVFSSAMTYYAQNQALSVVPVDTLPVADRVANASISYIKYIEDFFFPFNLAVLYPLNGDSINLERGGVTALILIITCLAALRHAFTTPWFIVGWLWFLGTLFPMIGVVQVGFQARADRYTYIPLMGLAIIATWSAAEFFKSSDMNRFKPYLFGGLVIALFSVLTFFQIGVWRSTTVLFEDTLKNTKKNFLIHTYLGAELERTGFKGRAILEYEKAIEINPGFPLPYNNMGMIFDSRGELDRAEFYFKRAIELNPSLEKPYFNLGNTMYKGGNLHGAELNLKKALSLNPQFAAAENSLGYILFLKKEYKRALLHLKRAILLAPDFYMAYNNLGIIYAETGKREEAVYYFNMAIKLEPENPAALQNIKRVRNSL